MFVFLQFLLFGLYIFPVLEFNFFCFPAWKYECLFFIVLGILIVLGAIAQLRNQLTPFPKPVEHGKLRNTGFFSLSRHPIYTGILMSLFFYSLYSCSGWRLVMTLAFLALFYFKSSYEESLLIEKFPEYKNYKKRVGRFFPKIEKLKSY